MPVENLENPDEFILNFLQAPGILGVHHLPTNRILFLFTFNCLDKMARLFDQLERDRYDLYPTLQSDYNSSAMENFSFIIFQVNNELNDLTTRTHAQQTLRNWWTGPTYN